MWVGVRDAVASDEAVHLPPRSSARSRAMRTSGSPGQCTSPVLSGMEMSIQPSVPDRAMWLASDGDRRLHGRRDGYVIQPGHVLAHELRAQIGGQIAHVTGDDLPGVAPGRVAMREIVGRHEVV